MTNKFLGASLALLTIIGVSSTQATASDNWNTIAHQFAMEPLSNQKSEYFEKVCRSHNGNLKFACQENWEVQHGMEQTLVRISQEPQIILRLFHHTHREPIGIRFGWTELRALNRYSGWFDMTHQHQCGRKLIQTRGYLKSQPRAQAFDFYVVDWEGVYAAQFSVDRTIEYDQHQKLFDEIVQSVEFMAESTDVVNFVNPNNRQCQTITRE